YCRGMLMAEKHTTKSSARADADADHSERIAITKNFPALMSGTVAFVGVLISGANIWVAYIGKNKLVGWVELLRNPSLTLRNRPLMGFASLNPSYSCCTPNVCRYASRTKSATIPAKEDAR